jgi:hypothetical protein
MWTTTEKAAEQLGIHPQTLRKMRRDGWLKFGSHYRSQSSPTAVRPRLSYNLEKLEELFATERRKWQNYAKN